MIVIPIDLLNVIFRYLTKQPYGEVTEIIESLKKLQTVEQYIAQIEPAKSKDASLEEEKTISDK